MKILLGLILIFGIAAGLPTAHQKTDERVIGATTDAAAGQFPWTAGVMSNRFFICGGVLIGVDWVLTSAECVVAHISGLFSVELGNLGTISSTSLNHPVKYKVIHPAFVSGNLMHNRNLALLRLITAIVPSLFVNPIPLPDFDQIPIADHTDVQLSGWGLMYNMTATTLQYVDLQTMTVNSCIEAIGGNPHIHHDFNVCTAPYSSSSGLPSGACERDEGSPLVWQYAMKPLLVGIVSINDCMEPATRKPTIYTSTFGNNREWIYLISRI